MVFFPNGLSLAVILCYINESVDLKSLTTTGHSSARENVQKIVLVTANKCNTYAQRNKVTLTYTVTVVKSLFYMFFCFLEEHRSLSGVTEYHYHTHIYRDLSLRFKSCYDHSGAIFTYIVCFTLIYAL